LNLLLLILSVHFQENQAQTRITLREQSHFPPNSLFIALSFNRSHLPLFIFFLFFFFTCVFLNTSLAMKETYELKIQISFIRKNWLLYIYTIPYCYQKSRNTSWSIKRRKTRNKSRSSKNTKNYTTIMTHSQPLSQTSSSSSCLEFIWVGHHPSHSLIQTSFSLVNTN